MAPPLDGHHHRVIQQRVLGAAGEQGRRQPRAPELVEVGVEGRDGGVAPVLGGAAGQEGGGEVLEEVAIQDQGAGGFGEVSRVRQVGEVVGAVVEEQAAQGEVGVRLEEVQGGQDAEVGTRGLN